MKELIELARNRAKSVACRYKVICICFNSRGEFLGLSNNSHRANEKLKGIHAEVAALRRYNKKLSSILLLRFGASGALRPIHCCPECEAIMKKKNIKIILAA